MPTQQLNLSYLFIFVFGFPIDVQADQEPIIFVNGFGGSDLEATISDDYQIQGEACKLLADTYKKGHWKAIWPPDASSLAISGVGSTPCWTEMLKLKYNASTNQYGHTGVIVRTKSSWETALTGIPKTHDSRRLTSSGGDWWQGIVDALRQRGYDKTSEVPLLYSVDYDFRLGPVGWAEPDNLFPKLKEFIENVTTVTNKKVHIVALSMGPATIASFLQTVDQAWKDEHLLKFIALNGAFAGGGAFGTEVFVSNTLVAQMVQAVPGILQPLLKTLTPQVFQGMVADWAGAHMMTPQPIAGAGDPLLVEDRGGKRNYTVSQTAGLYQTLGLPGSAIAAYSHIRKVYDVTKSPGVETYCFHGNNVSTQASLSYESLETRYTAKHTTHYTQLGDGTVAYASNNMCARFQNSSQHKYYSHEVMNAAHWSDIVEPGGQNKSGIGKHPEAIAAMMSLLAPGSQPALCSKDTAGTCFVGKCGDNKVCTSRRTCECMSGYCAYSTSASAPSAFSPAECRQLWPNEGPISSANLNVFAAARQEKRIDSGKSSSAGVFAAAAVGVVAAAAVVVAAVARKRESRVANDKHIGLIQDLEDPVSSL
jgi:hypothetical protein